ncbi:2'-5' RNA ligase family protein [Niabella sp.]|uniref:2'-5' RNA ligase family protein n=1 Tax=Niabella sp. TaxID=1962976 RepID=UPI00262FAC1E|nr:2'-5' RNA ligase family protein [Niabella sp.]
MQDIITYQRAALNHYRLILDTPAAVKRKIADAGTRLNAFFPGTPLSGGTVFMYLASFSVYEPDEVAVTDLLHRVALAAMPYRVHLKGFAHLETKEIYIPAVETAWITALIDTIAALPAPWSNERFNVLPRISLARNLQPWQFDRVWPYFEKESFQARFVMDGMLLLRQLEGAKPWQIERKLLFENQLIAE